MGLGGHGGIGRRSRERRLVSSRALVCSLVIYGVWLTFNHSTPIQLCFGDWQQCEDFILLNSSAGAHMDQNATKEETESLRSGLELVRTVSDKHIDLLRPSARYYSVFKGQATDAVDREKGRYTLIRDAEDLQLGIYDKPLPCFGCGIGWFSFLLGFVFPVMWYYATILYFGNYYRRDPRERAGLAASAVAAMACSVVLLIIGAMLLL